MNTRDLTPDQIERSKACRTTTELVALAKAEGIELIDEQMESISGGWDDGDSSKVDHCANCGSMNLAWTGMDWKCLDCGMIN